MVDIIIGAMPSAKVAASPAKIAVVREKLVDAQILDMRPARKGRMYGPKASDERRKPAALNVDPSGSMVLVLMISDSSGIPLDLKTGEYRISLRITPKRPEKKWPNRRA